MNNEIKEILDYLSDDSKSFIICGVSYYKISDYKTKVLLDYITNLQEVVYNLTTMTVNGDRTQIKNTAQYKLEQCQQRIDKAIELLEDDYFEDGSGNNIDKVLSILRGEDNE